MKHPRSMTLHVVHDRGGRILAAAAVPNTPPEPHDVPIPLPFARAGQRLAQIKLPDIEPSELASFLERHRVKGSAERATLVEQGRTASRKKQASARKK